MQNYRYDGSRRFRIKSFDCADTGEFQERHEAIREFTENLESINEYQQRLFAEQKEGIIFVFQAMDAAGKDGAVRAVLSCLSPQGVSEHSFKVPSAEENRHDFLWRFARALPEKGSISILNRSYYEDVLVQKVHEIYRKNKFADRIDKDQIIDQRYEQIRNFEKYLWENSIRVVKIFLNVSKDEQGKRFISRVDTPKKNWKFSSGDIDERQYWDQYMEAYETCINRTARKNTPWYVVPADHKWYARLVISRIVLSELKNMNPQWPVLDEAEQQKLQEYRARLVQEVTPRTAEEEKKDGKKVKPSDTAVEIAMKQDRQALSEKKFRQQLKKSVFENFSQRFGVSEQTQQELGKVYLNFEELNAKADAADIAAVKELCKARKDALAEELEGYGKEARKLYERYKKAARTHREAFEDAVNSGYTQYEEELRQFMVEYELAVSGTEADAAAAMPEYTAKVKGAYNERRARVESSRAETEAKIEEITAEFSEMGQAFRRVKEQEAAEAAAAEAETAEITEEVAEAAEAAEVVEEAAEVVEEAAEVVEEAAEAAEVTEAVEAVEETVEEAAEVVETAEEPVPAAAEEPAEEV